MSRNILDPEDRRISGNVVELDRVPIAIRDTGSYPDLDQLQPGDLLLVSPSKPNLTARMIQWGQQRVHSADNAIWMHAALYLGDNALVEIDGGGVSVSPLFKYVLTHKLLFRRVLTDAGADISPIVGYRIAIAALKEFKRRYSHENIFITAYDCLTAGTRAAPTRAIRSRGSICSDFFNEVVFATTNRPAAPVDRLPLQPADLSASKLMRDISIGWGSLV